MKHKIAQLVLQRIAFLSPGPLRLGSQLAKLIVAHALLCCTSLALAQSPSQNSFGSGFAVSETHILTAYHVIRGKDEFWIGPVNGKSWTKAQLIKVAPEKDLALLQANIQAKPLAIANWAEVPIGLEVYVIGYPQPTLQGLSKKITQGIINGNLSENDTKSASWLFQLSAEISKGNSGGPVIAADGSVVGMVARKLDALGAAQKVNDLTVNVNYALKSNHLIEFLKDSPAEVTPSALSVQTVMRPMQVFSRSEGSVFAVLGKTNKDKTVNNAP